MLEFADFLVSPNSELNLREALQQPVSDLLGVGQEAVAALDAIGVETIFDLGSSVLFAQAASAINASSSTLGFLANDVLKDTAPEVPPSDVAHLPIENLRGLSTADATTLSSALGVATIREFALWPPRQIAHTMVSTAAGTNLGDDEEDRAEGLRPRLGEYPTERVYYDSLVMLGTESNPDLSPLSQPLSLDQISNQGIGFGTPALGALATYSQSWFAQGVTLGHMVHSLALAPGEATRVAVVDWARRTRASVSESVDEREQLDNSMDHARAASEVQNAVADEMQSGGSMSTGWAKSKSRSKGIAGSIGGGIAGSIGGSVAGALGFGVGGSKTSQESETRSGARSTSWSVGSKSVLAEMTQRVNDRTEQHATSVRNRRAAAVREVSQSEHEEVSTRIVANYNHMHALTVQYYEVVQIYRVSVQLNEFVRAIFLPFELMDFTSADAMDLVARFRGQLLDAALTERTAELLIDDRGRVEVRSGIRVNIPINVGILADADMVAATTMASTLATSSSTSPVEGAASAGDTASEATSPSEAESPVARPRFSVVRPGPIAEVIPGDARLVSIGFDDVGVTHVRIDQPGVPAATNTFVVSAATNQVDFTSEILLRTIEGIHVARAEEGQADGSMVLRYESDGRQSIATVPLSLAEGTRMQKAAYFSADASDRRAELLAHLQANRGYYTGAVFENLDSASLVMLLSGISWQGKALADQIEPNPIAVVGNYLVLRAPAEDNDLAGLDANQTWGDLRKERGVDFEEQDVRLVPIPTGGVFAEAVLGRSNSAEKLDITRFWNWQDSPIPLQPPEIAPTGLGSRATPETLTSGQLSAPVLNLMSPTPLPDPTGLSAALGALANGSMFRDMSGLAGTQAAAQAASSGTLTAATEAGRIASENFKAATNQATEMGKAAADMWKVLKSSDGGGSGKKSTAGISGDGARVNQGRDLDERGVSGPNGQTSASGPRVTEHRPEFAAAAHVQPPVTETFSRELAYSDESAAVSPGLLGAATTSLGSVGTAGSGQGPGGVLSSVGQGFGYVVGTLQSVIEQLYLTVIRNDVARANVSLQGAELYPMSKHDNATEYEAIELAAWTNSSKHVYINLKLLADWQAKLINAGVTPDPASKEVRATAVLIVWHEIQHVVQFAGNQDQPPASYQEMIEFEEQAYAGDVTWLKDPQTQNFLLNDIETTPRVVSDLEQGQDARQKLLAAWKTNLTTEAVRKSTLIAKPNEFLPPDLGGNPNYAIGDLYKTNAP